MWWLVQLRNKGFRTLWYEFKSSDTYIVRMKGVYEDKWIAEVIFNRVLNYQLSGFKIGFSMWFFIWRREHGVMPWRKGNYQMVQMHVSVSIWLVGSGRQWNGPICLHNCVLARETQEHLWKQRFDPNFLLTKCISYMLVFNIKTLKLCLSE